jgi:hypothetical protein
MMNKTTVKHKNLFLFLVLACFLGIILIFVVDGYMGRYDTLTMSAGEQEQRIEPQQWIDQVKYGYPSQFYAAKVGVLPFSYEVDNRRFSSYQADITVSIWKNQEKVTDVLSQRIDIKAFGKEIITWDIDTQKILTGDTTINNEFTLQINHGEIQRRIIIIVPPPNTPQKTIIIPPPQAQ